MWEFEDAVFFSGGRKTGVPGEKPSHKARTKNKLNPHMALGRNGTQATLMGGERPRRYIVHAPFKRRVSATIHQKHQPENECFQLIVVRDNCTPLYFQL